MRAAKIILYPLAGLFQFFLAMQPYVSMTTAMLLMTLGTLLIALAILHLQKALTERAK